MKQTIEFDHGLPKTVTLEDSVTINGTVHNAYGAPESDVYLDYRIIEGSGVVGKASVCSGTFGDFSVELLGDEPGTLTIHVRSSENNEVYETYSIEVEEATKVALKPSTKSVPPVTARVPSERPMAQRAVAAKAPFYMPEAKGEIPPPPRAMAHLNPLGLHTASTDDAAVPLAPSDFAPTSVMTEAAQEELVEEVRNARASTAADEGTVVVTMEEETPTEAVEFLNSLSDVDPEAETVIAPETSPEPSLEDLQAQMRGTNEEQGKDTFTGGHPFIPSSGFEDTDNVVLFPARRSQSTWLIAVGAAAALAFAALTGAHLASNGVTTASMAAPAPQTVVAPAPLAASATADAIPCITAIEHVEGGYLFHCR